MTRRVRRSTTRRAATRSGGASRPRRGPARHGADAGHELAEAERLHDVVVGTQLEADDAVDLVAARGHHDDGDVVAGPDLAAELEAVDVGEPEIEEDDVGRRAQGAERVGAPIVVVDGEALPLEPADERGRDRRRRPRPGAPAPLWRRHVERATFTRSWGAPPRLLGVRTP